MKIKRMLCGCCGKESHNGEPFTFMIGTYYGAMYVDKNGNMVCNQDSRKIQTLNDLIDYINKNENADKWGNRPDFSFSCFCVEDEAGLKLAEFEDGTILTEVGDYERVFRKAFMEEE